MGERVWCGGERALQLKGGGEASSSHQRNGCSAVPHAHRRPQTGAGERGAAKRVRQPTRRHAHPSGVLQFRRQRTGRCQLHKRRRISSAQRRRLTQQKRLDRRNSRRSGPGDAGKSRLTDARSQAATSGGSGVVKATRFDDEQQIAVSSVGHQWSCHRRSCGVRTIKRPHQHAPRMRIGRCHSWRLYSVRRYTRRHQRHCPQLDWTNKNTNHRLRLVENGAECAL